MQIPENSPTTSVTIAGNQFIIPAPFTEGYALNTNEAQALNQLLRENVRNNLAPREGLTQEAVDEYVATYEFGTRRGGGAGRESLTPVQKRARAIAKDKITAALAARGQTIDSKNAEAKAWLADRVAELANRPEIVKLAERQVRDLEKLAVEDLSFESVEDQQQAAA